MASREPDRRSARPSPHRRGVSARFIVPGMVLVLVAGFMAGRLTAPAALPPVPVTAPAGASTAGPFTLDADFKELVDGDTLWVEVDLPKVPLKVRLIGVQAPEQSGSSTLAREAEKRGMSKETMTSFGEKAKTLVMTKLVESRGPGHPAPLRLLFPRGAPRWSMDRILAYVFVDGADLGEALLRENLAWRDTEHRRDEDDERASAYDELAKTRPGPQ